MTKIPFYRITIDLMNIEESALDRLTDQLAELIAESPDRGWESDMTGGIPPSLAAPGEPGSMIPGQVVRELGTPDGGER